MEHHEIVIEETGYSVFEVEGHQPVIQGVQDFGVACELHEMLEGEKEEFWNWGVKPDGPAS